MNELSRLLRPKVRLIGTRALNPVEQVYRDLPQAIYLSVGERPHEPLLLRDPRTPLSASCSWTWVTFHLPHDPRDWAKQPQGLCQSKKRATGGWGPPRPRHRQRPASSCSPHGDPQGLPYTRDSRHRTGPPGPTGRWPHSWGIPRPRTVGGSAWGGWRLGLPSAPPSHTGPPWRGKTPWTPRPAVPRGCTSFPRGGRTPAPLAGPLRLLQKQRVSKPISSEAVRFNSSNFTLST